MSNLNPFYPFAAAMAVLGRKSVPAPEPEVKPSKPGQRSIVRRSTANNLHYLAEHGLLSVGWGRPEFIVPVSSRKRNDEGRFIKSQVPTHGA